MARPRSLADHATYRIVPLVELFSCTKDTVGSNFDGFGKSATTYRLESCHYGRATYEDFTVPTWAYGICSEVREFLRTDQEKNPVDEL